MISCPNRIVFIPIPVSFEPSGLVGAHLESPSKTQYRLPWRSDPRGSVRTYFSAMRVLNLFRIASRPVRSLRLESAT